MSIRDNCLVRIIMKTYALNVVRAIDDYLRILEIFPLQQLSQWKDVLSEHLSTDTYFYAAKSP